MKDIYYINSNNKKISLLDPPYMLQTGELYDSFWEYESNRRAVNGAKITSIRKKLEERSVTLSIINYGRENFEKSVDHLHEVLDFDAIMQTPGRLYVGDMYVNCYVISSEKSDWESDAGLIDVELTLVMEYPMWIGENPYTFHSFKTSSRNNKIYPGKYPYRYANGMSSNYIINPNFIASNFCMIIYGPVNNPQVVVGGIPYLVNIVLEEKEYLKIDSRAGTIIKVMRNGEEVNAFHNREKGRTFFIKIQPGRQVVSWTGKFDFDLVIYEERSEPKWIE